MFYYECGSRDLKKKINETLPKWIKDILNIKW